MDQPTDPLTAGFGVPSLLCPHCAQRLDDVAGGVQCPNGHRFDRAREGYVHLLPAGRIKGRPAGDDEPMVKARRAFFDAGHYRPVMATVAERIGEQLATSAATTTTHVLDAGCGEGAYLAAVTGRLGNAVGWGIDVSKPAVRLAAKRYKAHRYAVASSYRLPFADGVLDAVITVFAPRHFPELFRVLRPGGIVVVASPGPEHLDGLKALLYDEPRTHEVKAHVSGDGEPPPEHVERVRFDLHLAEPNDVVNLLQMTPYWWHARPEHQRAAVERDLSTIVDIWVTTHRKP
ncbi:MAG: putative RNA methyltransferase [Acidimicrobiia bacterium]